MSYLPVPAGVRFSRNAFVPREVERDEFVDIGSVAKALSPAPVIRSA
jgi:hypothetical protein